MSINVDPASQANTPAILTSAGDILAENVNRRFFSVQNVGTNPVFIRLGTGASTTVFHSVIKGGTGNSDGLGGSYSSTNVCYTGVVSIDGTTPKVVVTEM